MNFPIVHTCGHLRQWVPRGPGKSEKLPCADPACPLSVVDSIIRVQFIEEFDPRPLVAGSFDIPIPEVAGIIRSEYFERTAVWHSRNGVVIRRHWKWIPVSPIAPAADQQGAK